MDSSQSDQPTDLDSQSEPSSETADTASFDSGTEIDDTGSEGDEAPIDNAAIYEKNRKICDEAKDEQDCKSRSYRLDSGDCFDDCWSGCLWVEFTEAAFDAEGRCTWGDDKGVCVYQSGSGDNPSPWWQDIAGCGRVDFQPSFLEEDGRFFLGEPQRLREASDVKVQPCSFHPLSGGTPSECDCLCDWPLDPDFECDSQSGVCLDTSTGLHWTARLDGSLASGPVAAKIACENLKFAGFDDWRLPTLEELSTVVRGCPNGEPGSSCPITSACSGLECADAACSFCDNSGQPYGTVCPSAECANSDCVGCVAFGEGACASCQHMKGPGHKGCYRVVNLDWACTTFWSSTKGDDLGPDGQPRFWGIDFERGGRFLSSWWVEQLGGGSTLVNRPFACVRP